eukprot:COSAG02_NODE_43958_length_370_cov_0.738007_1_plen_86_part_10
MMSVVVIRGIPDAAAPTGAVANIPLRPTGLSVGATTRCGSTRTSVATPIQTTAPTKQPPYLHPCGCSAAASAGRNGAVQQAQHGAL